MAATAKATISVRKYIKWGDDQPSEPTSTLVMTSPRKFYVDTRILMPTNVASPSALTTIDWAFAGTSFTTPASGEQPEHTVFTHWVDSTTPDAETIVDEGDMLTLTNGEQVERGQMLNPTTGSRENYEESWANIKPIGERTGWVVKVEGPETRGMVIRIGGFAQAVLRQGTEFGIRRWKQAGRDQIWETVVGIGSCDIPTELLGKGPSRVAEGEVFQRGDGMDWVCVESFVGNW